MSLLREARYLHHRTALSSCRLLSALRFDMRFAHSTATYVHLLAICGSKWATPMRTHRFSLANNDFCRISKPLHICLPQTGALFSINNCNFTHSGGMIEAAAHSRLDDGMPPRLLDCIAIAGKVAPHAKSERRKTRLQGNGSGVARRRRHVGEPPSRKCVIPSECNWVR